MLKSQRTDASVIIASAWVLIPPSKPQPSNFFYSPTTQAFQILTSPPRQTKSPDNLNTLNMLNNKTHTNFKAAYIQVTSVIVSCSRII